MGTARRPPRRNVGRLVWGGLMVVCIGVVGASFPLGSQALEQAQRDASARAVAFVDEVIAPVLEDRPSTNALTTGEKATLRSRIGKSDLSDDGIENVRLWSRTGDLLFSTDRDLRIDQADEVRVAIRGSVESSLSGKESGRLLETFVPTPAGDDPSAVTQVVQPFSPIASRVKASWSTIRSGAGGAAAFFLALLLLSLARSRRRGAGVPGFATADGRDRNGAGGRQETPAGYDRKLAKSEEARIALEEQLGQLRTQMAEVESRSAERAAVFGSQITEAEGRATEAEGRAKELEGLLRDAEARASRVAHEAPFADAVAENENNGERRMGLEQELAEARSGLEAARSRLAELEPLVTQSAARVDDAEARVSREARAADARAREVEAKADERERRLHVAEMRVAELESYTRDSDQRLAASADAAEQSALRIRELQGQLEGARHDGEAAVRRAEDAEARLEAATALHDQASTGTEPNTGQLQSRILEMEAHAAQLEEIARSAEERAGTARFEADEAIRAQRTLGHKVEQMQQALDEAEASLAGSRTAEIEAQLAEAHRAGKEAFRLVGDAREDLERTMAELAQTRGELEKTKAELAKTRSGLERTGEAGGGDRDRPASEEQPMLNGHGTDPESSAKGQVAEESAAENAGGSDDEEDGPSLRFRLAHSAAQRKGRAKDRDDMWSS